MTEEKDPSPAPSKPNTDMIVVAVELLVHQLPVPPIPHYDRQKNLYFCLCQEAE